MPTLPPITRNLIIACLVVMVLQAFTPLVDLLLPLYPVESGRFIPWQVLTYAFVHADSSHLFFNMLGLWMFGQELERLWGPKRYLQFLLASTLAAAAAQLVLAALLKSFSPTVGASGALFGLMAAYGMLFPNRQVMLFMVMPTSARNAVLIFGAIELFFGFLTPVGGGVAHFAHLGGLVGGWLMIRYWRGHPPFSKRRR